MRKNANASSAPARGEDSPGSGLQRRYLFRLIRQIWAEPALGLGERDSLPGGVVGDLVAGDPADREVARLRMVEVQAADARAGDRGEVLRQLHPGAVGAEQLEELRLLAVVGARGVAEGRPDTAVALGDQLLARKALVLVPPVASRLLVEELRERLGEPVGNRLDHDRAIVVVLGLVPSGHLVGAVDRDGE